MYVDRAIARVRRGVKLAGSKLAFARRAGLDDTNLRRLHEPDWNPTADTLRRAESASVALHQEYRQSKREPQGERAA